MIDRIREDGLDLTAQAEHWKETALDMSAVAKERLAKGTDAIREYTVHQPARALGVALGMGVLLGWLIKRR